MTKIRAAALTLLLLLAAIALTHNLPAAADANQEGYPPPVEDVPLPDVGQSTPLTVTLQPYPAGGTDFIDSSPVPIGGQSGAQANEGDTTGFEESIGQSGNEAGNRGLVFLWLGFLATFLVFLTSVVGSIILFTRRNDS